MIIMQDDIDAALECAGAVYGRGALSPERALRLRHLIAHTASHLGLRASAETFWQAAEVEYRKRQLDSIRADAPWLSVKAVAWSAEFDMPDALEATQPMRAITGPAAEMANKWQANIIAAVARMQR
jgi:hypothetical protein